MDHVILALLWILWCVVHSGLVSPTITEYFRRRLGSAYRFYRLFFNALAVASVVPLALYTHLLGGEALFVWSGFLQVAQVLLLITAAMLFVAGAKQYDLLQFLGLRQVAGGSSHSVLTQAGGLSTSGVLSITRHPWYLAAILLVWTADHSVNAADLITNTVLTVYLILGTLLEERKLCREFGDEYREYCRRVSMLFPTKWLISRWAGETKDR